MPYRCPDCRFGVSMLLPTVKQGMERRVDMGIGMYPRYCGDSHNVPRVFEVSVVASMIALADLAGLACILGTLYFVLKDVLNSRKRRRDCNKESNAVGSKHGGQDE